MLYEKKNEDHVLQEYQKLLNSECEVIKVDLIICLTLWLSCSPDRILVYGSNIWEKRVVEIKCPYNCRRVLIFRQGIIKIECEVSANR